MEGLISQQQIDNIVAQHPTEQSVNFVVLHEHEKSCPDGLGLWMLEAVDSMETDNICQLVSSIKNLFVEAIDDISQIVCERGLSNDPVDQLLTVLPYELDRMYMKQFVKVFQSHLDHLLPFFKAEGIEIIS